MTASSDVCLAAPWKVLSELDVEDWRLVLSEPDASDPVRWCRDETAISIIASSGVGSLDVDGTVVSGVKINAPRVFA